MMNNSVYGKAMENLRKKINPRLINNAKDCMKYTSNFAAIHKIKLVEALDKPI